MIVTALILGGCGPNIDEVRMQYVIKQYTSYIKGERLGRVSFNDKSHPILFDKGVLIICDDVERQKIATTYKLEGDIISYKIIDYIYIYPRERESSVIAITHKKLGIRFLTILNINKEEISGKITCKRVFQTKIKDYNVMDAVRKFDKGNDQYYIESFVCQSDDKKSLVFFDVLGKEIFQHKFDKPVLYSQIQTFNDGICCYDGHNLMFYLPKSDKLEHVKTIELESYKNIEEVMWSYNPQTYDKLQFPYSYVYDGKKVYIFDESEAAINHSFEIDDLKTIMLGRLFLYKEGLLYHEYSFNSGGLIEKFITDRVLKPIFGVNVRSLERLYYFSENSENNKFITVFCERPAEVGLLREWKIPISEDIISYDYDKSNFRLALFSENNVHILNLEYELYIGGKIIDLR